MKWKDLKIWLLGCPRKAWMNTADIPLHGPATTATLSSQMYKGVRKVAASGADLSLHGGQTNGERESQAAHFGICVRTTDCVPLAVAYGLLPSRASGRNITQVELSSSFYCSPAFKYFIAILTRCRLTKQISKYLSSVVIFPLCISSIKITL